ncbi:MAG: threonylcarbamoyl-AMP synthase [Fibrobacterales bacterium]|nr:threonylcarbamoyl-AMP synthase [Fibrobacterales bacterium]
MPSTVLSPEQAGEILRAGGVVAVPTETVYGLAARADSAESVLKIFRAKGRPANDPLIVHIADIGELDGVASEIPPGAKALAEAFWPGPLTLVLPKRPCIPPETTSGLETVAVRMPSHPVARAVIRAAGVPLAAPSANPFGRTSPTCVAHLDPGMMAQVDGYVDGGPCEVGVESTIVGFFGGRPVLLRPGGLALEEIESVVGRVELPEKKNAKIVAPGQMPSHYAPRTPLRLKGDPDAVDGPEAARLLFGGAAAPGECAGWRNLSPAGDPAEAARNLYRMMRELDAVGARVIVADLLPDEGLGRAVNDRLRRAAAH